MSKEKIKKNVNEVRQFLEINWYATLRLNFSKLKFLDAIKFPIIVYGKLKMLNLSGAITINCPVKKGILTIGSKLEMVVTSYKTAQLTLGGELIINGPCTIGQDVALIIQNGGRFTIGEGSFLGNHTRLIVVNDVYFGRWVRFTYDSQLISTNFHYMKDMNTGIVKRMSKKGIVINDYCWIGNHSTIMAGVNLPEKSIVASNSLVNKDFRDSPEYPLFGGMPAKLITSGRCRVFNLETESIIHNFFMNNPEAIEFDASNMNIF